MGDLRFRRWTMLCVVGAVAVAIGAVTGAASGAGSPSPSPSPIPEGCQLSSSQPSAPMKLNAVPVGSIRKAIIGDTELFDCYDAHSTLASLKLVQTFIELVDAQSAGHTPTVSAVARTVETHTCTSDFVGGGVVCNTTNVPLAATKTPLAGCSVRSGTYPFAPVAQPSDPVAMATVPLAAGVVETVSVTLQVFDCRGSIGDLYLIAETGENVGSGHSQPSAIGTRYEGVICLKDAGTATVQSCALFTQAPANG